MQNKKNSPLKTQKQAQKLGKDASETPHISNRKFRNSLELKEKISKNQKILKIKKKSLKKYDRWKEVNKNSIKSQ